ncbi:exo-beta-N-acetylmuramidase NamZ family protein [Ancylomarina longa]|uniref:DUF1343 domain-containing protein n=1 Tax=Ancylomarina longa TaxID=2487017 RepID=A0A434AGA3_9BACT|nr:DUF1343 domain-containing protein [Ancylomarina longa]RUT73415.1 DUF1343 domain-containing protein [Ancylomarina longa]
MKMSLWIKYSVLNICFILIFELLACGQQKKQAVICGADNTLEYIKSLENKNVAVVANQASRIGNEHLVDFLLGRGILIKKFFSPEHGFRGDADAGEKFKNYKDKKTGLPIVSLYGKHYKPSVTDIKGIDVIVFDLQDVGVRFYTYISTLHYVMEICAEENIPLIVLDRPNPNAYYIDGPVLEKRYRSFVGMHPVPVVYGMTIGEYAKMINGEGWLRSGIHCSLTVIPCINWSRDSIYSLPVKPSPNLPNSLAVALYPSLCFFEGTVVSVGRGTDFPFQCYGHPLMKKGDFSYQPRSISGVSKYPKFEKQKCYGKDLRSINLKHLRKRKEINITYLIDAYRHLGDKTKFFNAFFKNLAGTEKLREQIESGLSEEGIRKNWQKDIQAFKNIRKKYLIYPDYTD